MIYHINTTTMIRKTDLSSCFYQGRYKFFMSSVYSNTSIEIKKITRASVSWNVRKAFFWENKKLLQGFCFLKYNKFSRGRVLLFLRLEPKSARFHFGKYNKIFLFRKYGEFLSIRARKYRVWKWKKSFLLVEYKKSFWKNISFFLYLSQKVAFPEI